MSVRHNLWMNSKRTANRCVFDESTKHSKEKAADKIS